MGNDLQLDPRAVKVQNVAKIVGVGVVGAIAGSAVVVAGASAIVIGVVGIAGLVMVNLVIPVAARYIAVLRQKSLIAIAETFSKESLLEDEQQREHEISNKEQSYKTVSSRVETAMEALKEQFKEATPENQEIITGQLEKMKRVLTRKKDNLVRAKEALIDLKRSNQLLIALDEAARSIEGEQGAERNAEEIQRQTIARKAIVNRFRSAMAAEEIEEINTNIRSKEKPNYNFLPDESK